MTRFQTVIVALACTLVAVCAGLWLGGQALAVSAPERAAEEPAPTPRRPRLRVHGRPDDEE